MLTDSTNGCIHRWRGGNVPVSGQRERKMRVGEGEERSNDPMRASERRGERSMRVSAYRVGPAMYVAGVPGVLCERALVAFPCA